MPSQSVGLIQQQTLKMSPQMIQSIQLMALPLPDLQQAIYEEVEKNPALEIVQDNSSVVMSDVTSKQEKDFDPFENSSDPGYINRSVPLSGDDTKRDFIEGTVYKRENLKDILLDQLHVKELGSDDIRIGELLIQNLNPDGFHIENPEKLVKSKEVLTLRRLMQMIQGFDPVGCCTKDYIESLLVQIDLSFNIPDKSDIFVEHHLSGYKESKSKAVASKMGISPEALSEILLFLKTLNPFPGRKYGESSSSYVIPDLVVKKHEGEFLVFLNDSRIPLLEVNSYFTNLKKSKDVDKEARSYVNAKIKEANWFIDNIQRRNETLLKTAKAILKIQHEFLEHGARYLKPLILKDIATELEVHETTISRATNGKYIDTEWGIFELKYFFSTALLNISNGSKEFSKEGVKQIMKEMLEETKGEKISDRKISDVLKNRGIKIARRTVAKYRGELDIDSSFNR